ncbi:hypothetical protein [Ruegeria sp. HKCCD8929]|uniref:hypothetical protein n=1 Tax=Ruegeria sp. HKCCD8929 TaxID=2683006 RepID=UPI0020C5307B|nr:hypothetical protein [Ruegeria sp. HKCCD8929]
MRALFLIPVIGVLAACDTAVPSSGAGFNTPEYQAQREAALAGQTGTNGALIPPSVVSSEQLSPATAGGAPLQAPSGDPDADIANQTAAVLGATSPQASAPVPAPVASSNAGISDEQDFQAVSNRQTIESDAARIERNKANYQVIAPTAVPQRSGDAQPNIVQYALSTSHPVGTQLYSRAGFNLRAKAQRNCAGYPSADQAQIEFLAGGGPQRDRKGLDPDGDGYACGWDPSPFRRAVNN